MFSSSSSSGGGGGGGGGVGNGGGAGGGGGGCGCGSNGNGNGNGGGGGSGVWSSGMKKQQKRPKVPKRGPGVAELEKILREQEKSERGININSNGSSNNDNNNVEGFSVSHSCFNLQHHSSPPLKPHCPPPPAPPAPPSPPPLPPPMQMTAATSRPLPPPLVPIAPRFDRISPPPPPPPPAHLYGYNTATQGRNFPEQPLFLMKPSSVDGLSQPDHHHLVHHHHHSANSSSKNFFSEPSNNHLWSSYPALPQKRHCSSQYSSSMMKQVLGPCPPPPSSSSSQTGLHNIHEPPSNQSSYYNCISRNPEEPKMVGMKRPHPCSSYENSLVPSSTFQVPPIYSNFITRPHNKSSSNNDNHITASNFTSPNNDCFRDMKWGGPLGFNNNSSSRKYGSSEMSNGGSLGHHSNFSSFNGAPVPSPSMLMFQRELCNNNINSLPNFQVPEERMDDSSYQKSESSSGSDHQRPFYNFLEVKELVGKKETRVGSNHEGSEVGIDGPDLTLKL